MEYRVLYSSYDTLFRVQVKILDTVGYGKCLLKVFGRSKVVEYLKGDPLLQGDGGQVGRDFFPSPD
jgi:hypothetical protein